MTPLLGDTVPFLTSVGTKHACGAYVHTQANTHTHTKLIKRQRCHLLAAIRVSSQSTSVTRRSGNKKWRRHGSTEAPKDLRTCLSCLPFPLNLIPVISTYCLVEWGFWSRKIYIWKKMPELNDFRSPNHNVFTCRLDLFLKPPEVDWFPSAFLHRRSSVLLGWYTLVGITCRLAEFFWCHQIFPDENSWPSHPRSLFTWIFQIGRRVKYKP